MKDLPISLHPLMLLTDEELITSVLNGNSAAFELLMRRHNQRLFRLVRAVVTNDEEAEEVVQDVYVRAYGHLARFEGRSRAVTWLTRIAFHEALRSRRRSRRTLATEPEEMDRLRPIHSPESSIDPVDRSETRAMLTIALDALPDGLRVIVMLRLVEGLSTKETAECLRLTEANVKTSLHRARHLLAEMIERQAISHLRTQFSFASERCDRIVARVFERLVDPENPPNRHESTI